MIPFWPVVFLLATPLAAEPALQVPSGQSLTLQEVIWDTAGPQGLTVRFRFVAPQIAQGPSALPYEIARTDMDALCTHYALPRVTTQTGPRAQEIIISFADRVVEFGETAPDVVQFFEAYDITRGQCEGVMF